MLFEFDCKPHLALILRSSTARSIIDEASATGGWCPWPALGDSNVIAWLFIYGAGIVPALAAMSLIAFVRRASHQMPPRAVAQLTMSASLVWPLLAVAGVQIAGLLILKTALGLVRGGGDNLATIDDTDAATMLQPLAAAAA